VLCLVTDRTRCGGEDALVIFVRAAALAGVHLIQVREKDMEARALRRLVARCVDAVGGTRARVLVNDRLDVAIAARAHGLHLPGEGVPAVRVREAAPPGFLVGRSVHGRDEALWVTREGGLDYLLFGTVFTTESKPSMTPVGVDALRDVVLAVSVPVLAIGGVTLDRMRLVARTGAAGVAAIGLFADAASRGAEHLQTLVNEATVAFDTHSAVP